VEEAVEAAKILGSRRLGQKSGHIERNAGGSLVGEQFLEIFCAERSHKVLRECLMRM